MRFYLAFFDFYAVQEANPGKADGQERAIVDRLTLATRRTAGPPHRPLR